MQQYLSPAIYIDSDASPVKEFAEEHTRGLSAPIDQAVALYNEIRDRFDYNPYLLDLREESMKASALLTRNYGYCIEKANLLAATARVKGIPSRLGFANVRNHIGTGKIEQVLGKDLLVFHGYTELYLNAQWVKATPAFNKGLCEKLGVAPLDFNGQEDSIFQEFDASDARFMEYLHDYGHFADVPRDLFIASLQSHYPRVFDIVSNWDDPLNIDLTRLM